MKKYIAFSVLLTVSVMLSATVLANNHSPGTHQFNAQKEIKMAPVIMIAAHDASAYLSTLYAIAEKNNADVILVTNDRESQVLPLVELVPYNQVAILEPPLIIPERRPEYFVPLKIPLPSDPDANIQRWKSFYLKE